MRERVMAKIITKPDVEGLNDLQVNTLWRLYGQPYSSHGGSVSEKAERIWNAIVQRRGALLRRQWRFRYRSHHGAPHWR